ncbi:hypothetical protein J2T13_002685 [Paenibacillus sp. DS2015]|uniref:hypothetical protein n=1 Tax=Paenibacillus sp. DS2015 TaxID=3373917 RepID=UPI003D1C4425
METNNKIVLPVLGALLAAIIGGALWALIAVLTEYEIGLVAWAIGGLAGYAVSILANRHTSSIHQIIAVIASLIGILLGKYFMFSYFMNDSFEGMFSSYTVQFFQENFTELFAAMDILFVVLAVVTAWQLPSKMSIRKASSEQPIAPQ